MYINSNYNKPVDKSHFPTDAKLIILTSVYEDLIVFEILLRELKRKHGNNLYVVSVDDGSVKYPLTLEPFLTVGVNGVVLTLLRNVGHQRAIAAGLRYVSERMSTHQSLIVMDADGEDAPDDTAKLMHILDSSRLDVIVAKRANRSDSVIFQFFYFIYKLLFRILTGRPIAFGNFMAMRSFAARRLACMPELDLHVAATVLASKLQIGKCELDRGLRYAGESKMNFVTLTLHGFRGMMVFAEDVLVRVSLSCVYVASLSVVLGIVALGFKLTGHSSPGWFSVALGVLVLIFLQTGTISLMTLLLTGISRGKSVVNLSDQLLLIERISETG